MLNYRENKHGNFEIILINEISETEIETETETETVPETETETHPCFPVAFVGDVKYSLSVQSSDHLLKYERLQFNN